MVTLLVRWTVCINGSSFFFLFRLQHLTFREANLNTRVAIYCCNKCTLKKTLSFTSSLISLEIANNLRNLLMLLATVLLAKLYYISRVEILIFCVEIYCCSKCTLQKALPSTHGANFVRNCKQFVQFFADSDDYRISCVLLRFE